MQTTILFPFDRRIVCRAWQAYREHSKESSQRWKEVADYISVESCLEGIPLMFLASIYMYWLTEPCIFASCDPATVAHLFPSRTITLPPTPPLSADDVQAIHLNNPHCSQLSLTSDGWFTMGGTPLNAQFVDRPPAAFERIIELEIPGAIILHLSIHSFLSAIQMSRTDRYNADLRSLRCWVVYAEHAVCGDASPVGSVAGACPPLPLHSKPQ